MSLQDPDFENPAMKQVVKLQASPGAIAEAMEDPSVFEQVARGDLYMELTRLRQLACSSSMAPSVRLDYARFLAKMGKVEKPEAEGNPLAGMPQINIIFPSSGQTTTLGATYQGQLAEEDA
jgi:hypothetical protein